MRKFLPVVFASLVLVFSTSVVAFGNQGPSPSQTCKAKGDTFLGFPVDHSTCVVCEVQGDTPTCACQVLEDVAFLELFGFDNLGECISSGFTLLP